jgi:dienelactone hydrolase
MTKNLFVLISISVALIACQATPSPMPVPSPTGAPPAPMATPIPTAAPPTTTSTAIPPTATPSPMPTVGRRIEISPDKALVDEKVNIHLADFEPNQKVIVRARTHDDSDRAWVSFAEFQTDAQGNVDVASEKLLSGSYANADSMGLFWSMDVEQGNKGVSFFIVNSNATTITLTADVAGQVVASKSIERLHIASDVTQRLVLEDGLSGIFFKPAGAGAFPIVIAVGGSEGGIGTARGLGAMLASRGFAVLGLAYFNYRVLPPQLANIPLEYFETAIRWAQKQEGVRADRVAVVGVSRGGELALLLGATFPQIKAVVGYVPGSHLWGGYGKDAQTQPAWTYGGKPLPYLNDRTIQTALFSGTPAGIQAAESAAIQVEKINGPILVISGKDDKMWPSYTMSNLVMQRLVDKKHPYPDKHLAYDSAGHLISYPYLPTTGLSGQHPLTGASVTYGGTAQGTALARSDSWPQVLAFLKEGLK